MLPRDDFDPVATADPSGLDNAADHSSPPANRFFQSIPDVVHQVARRARFHDFQERFADAHALPLLQFRDRNTASRDVFLAAPRGNPEFLEGLDVGDQHLPAATPVQAVPKAFIFDGEYFVKFPDRLAMRDRLKQV
jgi:hypothetical protein